MKHKAAILTSALLLALVAFTAQTVFASDGYTIKKDITFITRKTGPLTADVFIPSAPKSSPSPAMVVIHGGGFVTGDKAMENSANVAAYLASRGYVVFNANYRLAKDGGIIPENIHDVKCALKWFRSRAADYGADPGKISIIGLSAGGYLASITAVTAGNPDFEPATCGDERADAATTEVPFAVIWYGIHDFTTMKSSSASMLDSVLFKNAKNKKEFKKKISPVTYATQAPPMFFLHGLSDSLVPYQQSREMCAAMKDAGRDCTQVEYENSDHAFVDLKTGGPGIFNAALKETADWLDKRFAELK